MYIKSIILYSFLQRLLIGDSVIVILFLFTSQLWTLAFTHNSDCEYLSSLNYPIIEEESELIPGGHAVFIQKSFIQKKIYVEICPLPEINTNIKMGVISNFELTDIIVKEDNEKNFYKIESFICDVDSNNCTLIYDNILNPSVFKENTYYNLKILFTEAKPNGLETESIYKIKISDVLDIVSHNLSENFSVNESIKINFNQIPLNCESQLYQEDNYLNKNIIIKEDEVIIEHEGLKNDTLYNLEINCLNKLSKTTEKELLVLKTKSKLKVVSYNPTFAYDSAFICIEFNYPIDDSSVSNITLNGQKGLFRKDGNKVCTNVSLSTDRNFSTKVPGDTISSGSGTLESDYENYTSLQEYPFITKLLPAQLYYQRYQTTCVLASVKIALSVYGINPSEEDIFSNLGQAYPVEHQCSNGSTPILNGEIWSCPNNETLLWGDWDDGFLGSINGSYKGSAGGTDLSASGLRAAKAYANGSYDISGSSLETLFNEVGNGHPVIYTRDRNSSYFRYCWQTPRGRQQCDQGFKHAKVLVGYTYNKNSGEYSDIKVYDPIYGILSYSYWEFYNDYNSNGLEAIVVKL